ncbi:hypothetical protein F1188_00330 [Roseospira marina]|uniref:Uncharacterized protein n=1 Tax=Roseospira marina TaxID=140057 RepID=A0A5M6IGA8_9PROT|nr:hypothetical protein [Roseospira marina]KAA5607254.1 hypothetical protein F1188_00330 [Roseospira marina]MBB4312594.1 hypothetical protein [Roseospira marina]MBB5085390.1 hypothetical protein [Roseospira marina]
MVSNPNGRVAHPRKEVRYSDVRTRSVRWAAWGLWAAVLVLGAPALASTDDPGSDVDATADERPAVTLCTAPWPPFVVALPLPEPPAPPVPPGAKPDPANLGFGQPSQTDAGDTAIPAEVDPAAEQVEVADADGAGAGDAQDPPPVPDRPTASDAGELPHEVAGPASDVEVLPPEAPWSKSMARIAVANAFDRQRAEASVVPPRPDSSDDGPTTTRRVDLDPLEAEVASAPPMDETSGEARAANPDTPDDGTSDDEAATSTDDGLPDPIAPAAGAPLAGLDGIQTPAARALLPQGLAGGPMTEVVQAACEAGGLRCRVSLVPWIRPRGQLDVGPCDAIFPVEDAPSTRGFMTVSRPVVDSRLAFFTLDTSIDEVGDLTEFVIMARGPSEAAQHAAEAVSHLDKSAVVLGPDLDSLIRRLIGLQPTDRIALYGNYHVVTQAMRRFGSRVPALGVVPDRNQVLRVGFARDRVPGPVIEAFDAGLKRLHDTRRLQTILDAGNIAPIN